MLSENMIELSDREIWLGEPALIGQAAALFGLLLGVTLGPILLPTILFLMAWKESVCFLLGLTGDRQIELTRPVVQLLAGFSWN